VEGGGRAPFLASLHRQFLGHGERISEITLLFVRGRGGPGIITDPDFFAAQGLKGIRPVGGQ